jgi:diguanylate cyclase (GGDEF)-like protein
MEKIGVLVVEDSSFMRNAISTLFTSDPRFYVVGSASNGYEAIERMARWQPSLVTMDWDMPDMDGFEALRQIMAFQPVPIIMLSSYTEFGTQKALDAISEGAADCFSKNQLFSANREFKHVEEFLDRCASAAKLKLDDSLRRLQPPGEAAVRVLLESIRLRKHMEENLLQALQHDLLTGLPNRYRFRRLLSAAVEDALANGRQLALFSIDLDQFKTVNERFGDIQGDKVLRFIANNIRSQVDEKDVLSRDAGDEFHLLVYDQTAVELACLAERIIRVCSEPIKVDRNEVYVSLSIGICSTMKKGITEEALLKYADLALTVAKQRGKGSFCFYNQDMEAEYGRRNMLEEYLRKALEQDQLLIYYQPQIELCSGSVIGLEALLRWHHPILGFIPPSEFIPIAEESGLIVPIGEWILRAACEQISSWHRNGLPTLQVSVNLSSVQFKQAGVTELIAEVLRSTGMEPCLLDLEITESMTMDVRSSIATLHELKKLGVRISMDDFGTGYSSLNYLKQFPIDRLKIDKSFIKDIHDDITNRAIVATIIALARNLQLRVIAEGVEEEEQAELLLDMQCDEAQGYWYSKPVPASMIEKLLKRTRRLI